MTDLLLFSILSDIMPLNSYLDDDDDDDDDDGGDNDDVLPFTHHILNHLLSLEISVLICLYVRRLTIRIKERI
jgi:hypothetical protein